MIRYDRSPIYDKVEFLFVGNGSEAALVKRVCDECDNATFYDFMKPDEYDRLMSSCDVGIVSLDVRFTIPNYPSRLLSYLENKMPVLCATDPNTDMGRIAEENGYGFWCESVKPEDFTALVDKMLSADRKEMGEKGYEFLRKNYTVENTYNAVMQHF